MLQRSRFCAVLGALALSLFAAPASAQHPVNSVYQDGVAVNKSTVRSYEQNRNRVRVSGASEVQSGNFSAAFGIDLGGVPYDRDTTDTTSAHDGVEVLVDSVGTRFKRAFATLYGGINPRGAYDAGTTYAANDSVSYQGSSYVSMVDENAGNTPSSSPDEWQVLSEAGVNTPIDWQGAYDNGTAYVVGDGVSYNGGSYVAVDDTTGNLPTDTDFWQILAERGEQGPQGDPGTNGTNGADGTDPGVLFNFDDGTTDADPGAGNLRADNASLASATQVFVSEDNRGGLDVEAFLLTLDDSTNTVKGILVLTDATTLAQATFNVTGVTDAADYVKVAVSGHSGVTTFSDGNAISFQFTRAGDKGADGTGTGDVVGPASSASGNLASYGDASGKLIADSGVAASAVVTTSRQVISGAGLTGGGDLSADRTLAVGAGTGVTVNADDVAVDKASAANVRSAASNKVLTTDLIETASAAVALSNAATVNLDWDSGIFFTLTISQTSALANPTNGQPGTFRTILVEGNDTTDRTLTFGNQYLNVVPTLTDIDSAQKYLLTIFCATTTHFVVTAVKATSF